MDTAERVILIVCLFGGFLWLRSRARSMDLSGRKEWVMGGLLLLIGLLLAEKWLFEKLPQGTVLTLAIKAAALAATFAAIGYGFLRRP